MCAKNFLLTAALVPFACSSAFVLGGAVTLFGGGGRPWTSDTTRAVPCGFSMSSMRGHGNGIGSTKESSRVDFVREVATGISVTAASVGLTGLGFGTPPALADSTGKYSSKTTAKRRYLPRIATLVKGFEQLRKDIDAGSATPSSAFFTEVLPDSLPAMDLYGSSMKRGESPDSKSRGLQKLAVDYGVACEGIAKTLGKGKGDAVKAYDKAAALLAEYLKGTELEPIGSDAYNT